MRVGIVGLGVMGRRHQAALGSVPGLEFAGAVDHHLGPRSLAELIDTGLDACIVATPTPDHAFSALVLAAARIPTLIEKPLAMTPAECAEVEAAFRMTGTVAVVGHTERFHPAVSQLRANLASGEYGRVLRVDTRRLGGPPRHRDGGIVLDLGTHDVDLVMWLTGDRYARLAAAADDVQQSDRITLTGTLRTGIEVRHELSWCSPDKVRDVTVECERGTLVADTSAQTAPAADPLTAQLSAFRDFVLDRFDPAQPLPCASLADGCRAVEVAAGYVNP